MDASGINANVQPQMCFNTICTILIRIANTPPDSFKIGRSAPSFRQLLGARALLNVGAIHSQLTTSVFDLELVRLCLTITHEESSKILTWAKLPKLRYNASHNPTQNADEKLRPITHGSQEILLNSIIMRQDDQAETRRDGIAGRRRRWQSTYRCLS